MTIMGLPYTKKIQRRPYRINRLKDAALEEVLKRK